MLFSGITSAVTVTGPRLSSVSDIVSQAYGIAPDQLVPLAGGYRNELWRAGDVVIRVERASPESVAWEHRLVRFLAERLEEVRPPIAAADGSTLVRWGEWIISVWPYVAGSQARGRYEPHAVAAAKLLRRLHEAAAGWDGGQRPGGRPVAGEGVRGAIHGDFYRGNVLFRRGRIVGLVDWEESCVDLQAYELANAVWQFCCSKREHNFDRRLARSMLDAYGSDLAPDDLVPLVLTRLRYELEVWGAESDEPYRTHLRRSIQKLGG
jgi:Ser/Thr protein kinase RdoA (MazF antagonist)